MPLAVILIVPMCLLCAIAGVWLTKGDNNIFTQIMGVLPLVFSTGAGAEMRHAMGVAVFSGMLGVTFFAPVFYVALQHLVDRRTGTQTLPSEPSGRRETTHA